MSKAPSAPDPYATSAAQTQSNQQTAAYNAALNRVSTYTPYGNLVYSQTGIDGTGAPQYRADISLTPDTQQQLQNQQAQDLAISQLGYGLADKAGQSLNTQVGQGLPGVQYGANGGNIQSSLNTSGVPSLPNSNDYAAQIKQAQDASYNKATAYLDPQYQNAQNDLDAKLANQGIMQGSTAYQRAQDELARQKTFAYGQAQDSAIQTGDALQNQLFGQGISANQAGMQNAQTAGNFANTAQQQQYAQNLSNAGLNNQGVQQALQQQSYLASLPLNQLNALRSGTQIQNPTFTPVPSATAQPTDVSGNINNAYQQQLSSYNNMMNGLFGIGSSVLSAGLPTGFLSDRRLKTAIRLVGETPVMKLPLYMFRYIWGGPEHVGVMAQDVIKVKPQAIIPVGNYMAVDYGMIC